MAEVIANGSVDGKIAEKMALQGFSVAIGTDNR
jgi:hypothetical protein